MDCVEISDESIKNGTASVFINKEIQRIPRASFTALDKKDVIGVGNHAADLFDQKDLFVSHFAAFTSSLRLIFKPGVMVAERVQLKR